ncbi:MAG: sodium:solute symporter family transporter [Desulfatibacillaceae bacterium]
MRGQRLSREEIVTLNVLSGKNRSNVEIAGILGVTEGAVRYQKRKAAQRVREAAARNDEGAEGRFDGLFNAGGREVFRTFGIPVTIGLLAGPFGDQSFWQRAFATKSESVSGAFIHGALLFGMVPLFMSVFGFVAAGRGLAVGDPSMVNVEAVRALLPAWVLAPFVFMLLSGLVSTLDSNLCAAASLAGHDSALEGDQSVRASRAAMIALATGGLFVANLPG